MAEKKRKGISKRSIPDYRVVDPDIDRKRKNDVADYFGGKIKNLKKEEKPS